MSGIPPSSHDRPDEYCIGVLKAIKAPMGAGSRILICGPVMTTTWAVPRFHRPPAYCQRITNDMVDSAIIEK